jgi:hypothetical protein
MPAEGRQARSRLLSLLLSHRMSREEISAPSVHDIPLRIPVDVTGQGHRPGVYVTPLSQGLDQALPTSLYGTSPL